jgi:hypothetical protein
MVNDNNPHDLESKKAFESLGSSMQEMYHKEMDKYKKDEDD